MFLTDNEIREQHLEEMELEEKTFLREINDTVRYEYNRGNIKTSNDLDSIIMDYFDYNPAYSI
jgi:hypothetical protein